MSETIKLIVDYGILMVIAGVFIWNTIQDRIDKKDATEKNEKRDTKYNESLQLLSQSNDNIASALNLLKTSTDTNNSLLKEHDERAIKICENIVEIKAMVNNCPKRK